jgi:hypothetical protein
LWYLMFDRATRVLKWNTPMVMRIFTDKNLKNAGHSPWSCDISVQLEMVAAHFLPPVDAPITLSGLDVYGQRLTEAQVWRMPCSCLCSMSVRRSPISCVLARLALTAASVFAEEGHHSKIDRGLQESVRRRTAVLEGKLF